MKRHIAAERGRKKLNHAVTAINTMNRLAGKLMEQEKEAQNPTNGDESEKSSVNGDAEEPETGNEDDAPDLAGSDGEGIPCIACDMIDQVSRLLNFIPKSPAAVEYEQKSLPCNVW